MNENTAMTPIDPVEEAIFHAASAISDPASREAFLERACGNSPEMRIRIRQLLKAEEDASKFINSDPLEIATQVPTSPDSGEPPVDERPGMVIGRYKLLQKIGEGGMGVVYMAEQREPVSRRVALKIIKPGMDTRQVVARFEAERQALAMMDHPNIAKVLDGGATESASEILPSIPSDRLNPDVTGLAAGRPYFVMELVQGVPITEFCDKNRLSTLERVKLFIPVCQAVQHAHQKGVIHRDIKPSNVLVTLSNGVPHPMVIDFGVAKALNQRLTEKTLFTQFATMIGTPAYMSPEQAEMSKLDVDTRSDIYSLGALFYELLTGSTPFSEERLRSVGYGEMQRIIAQEEPERPSTRLTRQRVARSVDASGVPSPGLKANPDIDVDLDWIVLKCLEKDRARRYETANGLVADIQRFIQGEPITARPPSMGYRLQKAVRRHRVAVASASAVVLALILGTGIATFSWFRERTARAEAVTRRNEADKARLAESTARDQAERHLYAANMGLAFQAFNEGNFGRIRELLDKYVPEAERRKRSARDRTSAPSRDASDPRGWEWHFLRGQTRNDELFTLATDLDTANRLAISSDGRFLASSSHDNLVRVWDWPGRRPLTNFTYRLDATSVAFTPDNRWMVSGGYDQMVHIHDTGTWREEYTFPMEDALYGLGVSPDSRLVAATTGKGTVLIWDLVSRQVRSRIQASPQLGISSAIAWAPDGKTICYGTEAPKPTVLVRDVDLQQEPILFAGHTGYVTTVAFSPDGTVIASGSTDGTVRIWDVRERREKAVLHHHKNSIFEVSFSPDGRRLASAGMDQTVVVWDTQEWRELRVLRGHEDEVWTARFTPDGRQLVTGSKDGTIRVWNPEPPPGQTPAFLPTTIHSATNSNWWWHIGTGDRFVHVHREDNRLFSKVDMWNRTPFKQVESFVHPPGCMFSHISRDETVRALAWEDGRVTVQDAATHKELLSLRANPAKVRDIHGFRQDLFLSITRENYDLELWDWRKGQLYQPAGLRTNDFSKYFASSNSRWVILCYYKAKEPAWSDVWDWPNQRHVGRFAQGHVSGAAITQDGRTLYTSSWDAKVRVWDVPSQKLVHTLGGEIAAYFSIVLSPDEKRLFAGTAHGKVKVWDLTVNPPHEIGTWNAHTGLDKSVNVLTFTPDGRTLFSRSYDGVRLWSAEPDHSSLERGGK